MFSGLESSRGSSFGKDVIVRREAEFPVSSITENFLRLRVVGCPWKQSDGCSQYMI